MKNIILIILIKRYKGRHLHTFTHV